MYRFNIHLAFVKKHCNELCILVGGVALFLLTLFLAPLADDWGYMASPRIQGFSLTRYRRLCDVLIGIFLQSHPGFFPHLNRVLITASHTICALFFYKISRKHLKVKSELAMFFAFVFLIGGNTITTVINYDCFNQTGSLMFGALGIYFFLEAGSIVKKFMAYFIFCILALCVKESGIVYFAIIPLFGVIKDLIDDTFTVKSAIKTLLLFYIPGFICALSYYFSPIIQSERLFVYGSNQSLFIYIVGIGMRIVFAYSHIDQVSLGILREGISIIPVSLVLVTVLLSIPILAVSFTVVIQFIVKKDIHFLVVLFLVASSIIVFTPTLLSTPLGNLWNYNCIVFFANFVFSCLLNTVKRKTVIICTAAFALSSAITGADIYIRDLQTCKRQSAAMSKIRASLTKEDIKSYIVYNLNSQRGKKGRRYPVDLYTMQQIFDLGIDLVSVFGYGSKFTGIYLCNEEFEFNGNRGNEPTYLDVSDAELLAYAQKEAEKAVKSGEYDVALILLPTDEFFLYQ